MGYFLERGPKVFSGDDDPLLAILPAAVDRLEFDYWSYLLLDWRCPERVLFHHSNLPGEWRDTYIAQRWYAIDPPRLHGLHSVEPLHWQPATFATAPPMWQALQALGSCHGMTQACHHGSGRVAILSMGRSCELDAVAFEAKAPLVMELVHRLCALSLAIHDREFAAFEQGAASPLTPRETSVLSHAAQGLTTAQIAALVSLTERTVQFHVSSAIAKLGVRNKTAAVARAMLLQLF